MTRRFTLTLAVLALLCASLIPGCYSFRPQSEALVNSVAILPFENQTAELTISDRLTTTVIDALIKDGSIKILPETEAEALLRGGLTSYQRQAYQFDESDRDRNKISGELQFTFADVFTATPLEGNALAVVHDADALEDATMLALAGFWLVDVILRWAAPLLGYRDLHDPAALPLLLLVLALFGLALSPLHNALSRRHERQCDRYALERTANALAYRGAFTKLARLNKSDPDPHPWVVWLFYDHPAIRERLRMADSC